MENQTEKLTKIQELNYKKTDKILVSGSNVLSIENNNGVYSPVVEMTDLAITARLPLTPDIVTGFSMSDDLVYLTTEIDDCGIVYLKKQNISGGFSDYIKLADITGGRVHEDLMVRDNIFYVKYKNEGSDTIINLINENFDIVTHLVFKDGAKVPRLDSLFYINGTCIDVSEIIPEGTNVAYDVSTINDNSDIFILFTAIADENTLTYSEINFNINESNVVKEHEISYTVNFDCSEITGILYSIKNNKVYFKHLTDKSQTITCYSLY